MTLKTTFLDGRLSVASMATPTDEEIAAIQALSAEDYKIFMNEYLDQPAAKTISDLTLDDIWADVLKAHRAKQKTTVNAL